MLQYPKPIMRLSELVKMGFPKEFLMTAYRNPKQTFAHKINPTKKCSPIVFETDGLEKYRMNQIKAEVMR